MTAGSCVCRVLFSAEKKPGERQRMEEIFDVIRSYHMIEAGMRVLAAVSGGADSVYLLQVLRRYQEEVPFELMAVHVEHGLRGRESLDDAAFVRKLCEREGVPCRVVSAQVRERAEREKLSLEEAGREERYRIFREILKEWDGQRIAVAHNRNDQAETVLWNLARGSGLKGLGGIRPVQGRIIRPLLFTGREEIEKALHTLGIPWRTDRTNFEEDYTRNRIRNSLLPGMEAGVNRQSIRHIAEAGMRLQKVQEYVSRQTDEAAGLCLDGDCIRLEPFLREDPLIRQELLRRMLENCGGLRDVKAVHIRMLEELSEMDCGKQISLPGGLSALREADCIRFVKENTRRAGEEKRTAVPLPVPGKICFGTLTVTAELTENSPQLQRQLSREKKYTKWLSYDTITNSLQVRTRKAGDYLVVTACGGTKKLKDYLIDRKIPQRERDELPLLADGSHILWVVGDRISEAAKVTPETRQVVKIQVCEGEKQ